MDPATIGVIVKGLDIAFTVALHYMNRQDAIDDKMEMLDTMQRIKETKAAIRTGSLSIEEAQTMLEGLENEALSDLRAAMARL